MEDSSQARQAEGSPGTPFLSGVILYLSKVVDPVTKYGAYFAGAMLFAMMLLTFFDVAGREIGGWSFVLERTRFFKPIDGAYEVSEFMMCLLISFGLAYCAQVKGHIRVDLILQYASRKVKSCLDILGYLVAAGFYAVLTWQSWIAAWDNVTTKAASTVLLTPLYPFVFLLTLGAGLLVLVFLRDLLKSIDELGQ